MRYANLDTGSGQKTKPKQTQFKPNQSQFVERTKAMLSMYIQKNKNKNTDWSYEKTNNRTYLGG